MKNATKILVQKKTFWAFIALAIAATMTASMMTSPVLADEAITRSKYVLRTKESPMLLLARGVAKVC